MRVTTKTLSRRVMSNLNSVYARMQKYHTQSSTGKKFQRPSENPIDATNSMDVNSKVERADQYGRNIHEAYSMFDEGEVSLKAISDSITSIKSDLLKGLHGTYNEEDRVVIANTVDMMRENVISQLNKEYAGKHIFGGFNTFSQPFTQTGGDTFYNEINIETMTPAEYDDFVSRGIVMQTGKATEMDTSMHGIEVIGYGSDNLLSLLEDISTNLKDPNFDISSLEDQVTKLDGHFTNVQNMISKVGTKMSNLNHLKEQNESVKEHLEKLLSDVEGVDLEEAIINFKTSEVVYQSALSVASKIIQPTLIDFLR